ncbi:MULTISPECIES: DNA/RNA non-specific endonuclease [unclassified Streptomyces]|uniref:DNA/RNA non-specific endonuclease n=1 Tax=unclassified Streptomyces TaxID=2593676 RepID=UPI00278BDCC5|nr:MULTISPECIES: DNA/RNA non-specific endonuclease [unclassified Streptomyces]
MDIEEILKDALLKLGMWWPDADADQLREAANAWRAFAESVDDVTAVTHKAARSVIDGNEGQSIEAFGDFWARYHKGAKTGWLDDLAESARAIAKGLDKYADTVDEAISHLWTEIGIAAAALGAGVLLAIVTGGAGAVAGSAAAEGVIAASASIGVTVSAEIAGVIGTTMTGVAFGAIESIAIDLAVAQPLHVTAGDQESISLEHAQEAGMAGALLGGALAGAGSGAAAIRNAGGLRNVLGDLTMPGMRLAAVGGSDGALAGSVLRSESRGGAGGASGRPMRGGSTPSYCKPLDSLGRATGVETRITREMLDTGTKASRRVQPPGWEGAAAGHTRGHLLARALGGDGRAEGNIVIMYDRANNEVMEQLESRIYDTVQTHGPVDYAATPVYARPDDLIPTGVHIRATGHGLDIDQTIINQ